jgi:hypothetical protein
MADTELLLVEPSGRSTLAMACPVALPEINPAMMQTAIRNNDFNLTDEVDRLFTLTELNFGKRNSTRGLFKWFLKLIFISYVCLILDLLNSIKYKFTI